MALLHLLLALQATSGVKTASGVKFTDALRITPERVSSWDHKKLGAGVY